MANGEIITLEAGSKLTARFRENYPDLVRAVRFDSDLINEIMKQSDCVGIRIYFGLDGDSCLTTVLVGFDQDGNDILDCIVDNGTPCPVKCSNPNALNPE